MHGSAEGADYSRSHTRLETERIANRDGHLTDTQLLGISESNVREVGRIDADDG